MLSNQFIVEVPTLTRELADTITRIAQKQLETSQNYKAPRLASIKESEDLYLGVVQKQLGNPFNECFPFLSGAVDNFLARIDDPPRVRFKANRQAAWKAAQKFQAAWDQMTRSSLPDAKWRLKDRHGKKNGLMSGRAVHKYFAENVDNRYRAVFGTTDYKLFHCQPDGGGILENHLFTGEEGIFKTKNDLVRGMQRGYYDRENVMELARGYSNADYQRVASEQQEIHSRHEALGMDPKSHSFIGQPTLHLVEWYLTYEGVRWYVLFDKHSGRWVRIKPMRELFSIPEGYTDSLFPYTSWATHEDGALFWSMGSADAWRPAAKYLNRVLNQELYNREKQNKGQRAYDPTMIHDVGALADWRPDGLVPVDTKGGKRSVAQAFYTFDIQGLNGSLDLASYVESFVGRNSGSTPGSKGAAEKDKAVGIYFGELQQVDEYIGTRNKSYTENWEELATRFLIGLKDNLPPTGLSIEMVGQAGFVGETLTKEDLQYITDVSVSVVGGAEEDERTFVDRKEKREIIAGLTTVNPRWKDEQLLRSGPFEEDEIRAAFDYIPNASKALMSEAAQAVEMIREGRTPKLNTGANTAYMDYIIQAAEDNEELSEEVRIKMLDFAMAHADIAVENEARNAREILAQRQAAAAGQDPAAMAPGSAPAAPGAPGAPAPEPERVDPLEEALKATQVQQMPAGMTV